MAPLILRSLSHPPEISSLIFDTINHLAARVAHPATSPTQTLQLRSLGSLVQRQLVTVTATPSSQTSNPKPIIPANYAGLDKGPTPGTVVGIVFGSVAGLLLVLWLIYTCFTFTRLPPQSEVVDETIVYNRRSSPSRRHSASSHSRSEVIEVSRQRSRSRTRSPTIRSVPPARRESTRRETVIIEETRRPSRPPPPDDIVEVTEELSDRPVKPRRSSGRQSGFRTIDPDSFGGGDAPMRKVSRNR